jgi:hypothetical protein
MFLARTIREYLLYEPALSHGLFFLFDLFKNRMRTSTGLTCAKISGLQSQTPRVGIHE